jgi:hypothetical protein
MLNKKTRARRFLGANSAHTVVEVDFVNVFVRVCVDGGRD